MRHLVVKLKKNVLVGVKITANGLQIGDVAEIEAENYL